MNKDAFSVSGFYRWNRLQIDPEPVLESFASTGTKYLVFDAETTFTFPEKLSFVRDLHKKAERYGLTFRDAHAPWGAGKDLNELTEESFVRHENIMAILGEYQVKTYTCHIGASCIYTTKDWEGNEEHYRSLAAKALERLLKCAEKYQVTLCVENCFEPATAAPEAVALVNRFDSPYLGLCLDCGHANLIWKEIGPAFAPGVAEMMLPDIVTVHVHDNDGMSDKHALPGKDGTIDWSQMCKVLKQAPRLLSLQSEVETADLNELKPVMQTLQNLWR